MTDFVEKPNPMLGNWSPCPYARAARLNNKIWISYSNVVNLRTAVNDSLVELEEYDVVVICFDHTTISATECECLTATLNETIMKNDYVILEDHPASVELINGVQMNFGKSGLFVIQKLSKLNLAAAQLSSKGYYHSWSAENLADVVNWR